MTSRPLLRLEVHLGLQGLSVATARMPSNPSWSFFSSASLRSFLGMAQSCAMC